ncbi:hypothetical protein D623_10010899 [Myotis brandtii]|uniref:Uncharacterized protein n=1 Tax=Myotis brandtii TaxID=109478 RepID=S7N185_MYOBR|nr:hypothetical protein D623_10010899 [Myotis brandtii]
MSQVQGKYPKGTVFVRAGWVSEKMAMLFRWHECSSSHREVLDNRHAVQQRVPVSPASGFSVSAPVALTGAQACGLLGPVPHLSSFVLQPAHSLLPPLGSHGAEISKTMALKPRALTS